MKRAPLRDRPRGGSLPVVNCDLARMVSAPAAVPTLQSVIGNSNIVEPKRRGIARKSEVDVACRATYFDAARAAAPAPQPFFSWIDGASYLSRIVRVRAPHGATLSDRFEREPLIANGSSALPRRAGCRAAKTTEAIGVDWAESCRHIWLATLVNDVRLRTAPAARTLANYDGAVGGAGVAVRWPIEGKASGAPVTQYREVSDELRIEIADRSDASIVGSIHRTNIAEQRTCITPRI